MCKTHAPDFNDGDLWELQLSQCHFKHESATALYLCSCSQVRGWQVWLPVLSVKTLSLRKCKNFYKMSAWMCHDFVSLAQVFNFSPKSDAFGAKNRIIQYIVKKRKRYCIIYSLFQMFVFFWNWKCFPRIALHGYFNTCNSVQVESNTVFIVSQQARPVYKFNFTNQLR